MTPYGVREVARVAHPCSSQDRWLAVFIAYFDESGHPSDQDVVTLGVLVAPAQKWKKFESSWGKILRRYKVPVFHMTEYKSRKAPYENWAEDDRIAFAASLAGIVKNAVVFGSSHSILVKDWNEVVIPYFAKRLQQRSWYIFLLQSLLSEIAKMVKLPHNERIACVFDRNRTMAYQAGVHYTTLLQHYGWDDIFEGISFEDKARFIPLQAADMLAHSYRRHVDEKIVQGQEGPDNKLLANLAANGRITFGRYSRKKLIEYRDIWIELEKLMAKRKREENDES